jgi:hypothetical protein
MPRTPRECYLCRISLSYSPMGFRGSWQIPFGNDEPEFSAEPCNNPIQTPRFAKPPHRITFDVPKQQTLSIGEGS